MMKNKIIINLMITIFIVCLTSIIVSAETFDLTSIEETYVRDNAPDSNFEYLVGLKAGTESGAKIRTYLKFNLSEVLSEDSISSAKLYLKRIGGTEDLLVDVNYVDDDSWNQDTLTWNNAPGFESPELDSVLIGSTTQFYEFDITPAVLDKINGQDVLISVLLKRHDESQPNNYKIFDEFSKPYIQITTAEAAEPPVIENISAPVEVDEGEYLNVSFTAYDLNSNIDSYAIYQDGQLVSVSSSSSWLTDYMSAGTYIYTFYVNDTTGLEDTETRVITVLDRPNVVINEIMPNPSDGEEWIELYNPLGTSVDLTGCILFIDSLDLVLDGSINADTHDIINWTLDLLGNESDILTLSCGSQILDQVAYGDYNDGNTADNAPSAGSDESIGRLPDGIDTDIDSNDFIVFSSPTKGAENFVNDITPPVISNVRAESITTSSADIKWDTDENSDSKVYFGETAALGSAQSTGSFVSSHTITLNSLTDYTLYYYQVESCDVSDNCINSTQYTFTTDEIILDIIPPTPILISVDGDSIVPYLSTDLTTTVIVDIGEDGDCRMSDSDESYDAMSDDFDCTGDGSEQASCTHPSQANGNYTVYIACKDLSDNKNIESDNLEVSYELIAVQVEDDLIPNIINGKIIIDGLPADNDTIVTVISENAFFQNLVDSDIPDFLKGNGYFTTGDQKSFITGEDFSVQVDGCNVLAAGTFLPGNLGNLETEEDLIIIDCDTIVPIILDINHTPDQPTENDSLVINAQIDETNIDNVLAFVSVNGNDFISMPMSYSTEWSVDIGSFNTADIVEYYIYVNDTSGNLALSQTFNFTVSANDDDGDGYSEEDGDCDDSDPAVNPGAIELDDCIDNNCNGIIDEGFDIDGDGYTQICGQDCNDNDDTVFPGASELEDGKDNDCDGIIDEGTDAYDDDGDGFTENQGDCNDADPAVNPDSAETCDGIDNDCDGTIDEQDAIGCSVFYYDGDSDTFGINDTRCLCSASGNYTADTDSDCADADADVNPGTIEICDGIDNDCDGIIDEEDSDGCTIFYADLDLDNFGQNDSKCLCSAFEEYVALTNSDCNDLDDTVFPGASELEDGKDNDCDGIIDEGTDAYDDDGDGFTENQGDCNDADPAVNPYSSETCDGIDNDCDGTIDEQDAIGCSVFYYDGDSDTFGINDTRCLCTGTGNYTSDTDSDCDDSDNSTYPGALELEDGKDNDCDGIVDEGTNAYDDDSDGFTENDGDCDDADPAVNPGAIEICDSIDNDCDGLIDPQDTTGCSIFYYDGDSDSFGINDTRCLCTGTGNYTADTDSDCNDNDADVNPGAIEICDGIDNDCDGLTDPQDTIGCLIFYYDGDSDSFGINDTRCLCTGIGNYTADTNSDCNDFDDTIFPGASELEDGKDNDCDGIIDEGTNAYDDDGDGFTENQGDCNDADPAVNPDAAETCDGIDNNCDGIIDEQDAIGCSLFYYDGDSDSFGINDTMCLCTGTGNYTADTDSDCDDSDNSTYPGALELEDGKDNDCDGIIDEGTNAYDDDGDGFTENQGDCNDANPNVYPGAVEVCNGIDDNCDGIIDEENAQGCSIFYYDEDSDGYGINDNKCLCFAQDSYTSPIDGDCDDTDTEINPGQQELCNGIDDNCDGIIDEGFPDIDGDGISDCIDNDIDGDGISNEYDNCPLVYNPGQEDNDSDGIGDVCDVYPYDFDNDGDPDLTDCNPTDPAIHHGAVELMDYIDQNCVNDAPVLSFIDDIYTRAGETLAIYPVAGDPDGDPIIITISEPVGDDGIWNIPVNQLLGDYPITITVSDGLLTASQTVIITIDEKNHEGIFVGRIRIDNDGYTSAGDIVKISVEMENTGTQKMKDLQIAATIIDLGIRSNTNTISLKTGRETSQDLYLEIPRWAPKGVYEVRLTISTDKSRRVIHRDIIVV